MLAGPAVLLLSFAPTPEGDEEAELAEKEKGDVPLRPSVPDGPPGLKNRRARPGRR